MLIKTSIRVAEVTKKDHPELTRFVDGKHDIAWSDDIDHDVSLTGDLQNLGVGQPRLFRTTSLERIEEQKEADRLKALRKAYLSVGMNSTSLAGQFFPEAMQKPIEGMELVVASYDAFQAWSDPTRTNQIQASLATGKAFLEAIDVFAPYFPGLKVVQPYTQGVGVLLKTSESLYLLYKANEISINRYSN